jgi:hypothetical protein
LLSSSRCGAPDWIANERFDIVAKMEGDPPSIVTTGPGPMRLAMRALLGDRFGLVVRGERRDLDIYALTIAKSAAQLGRALKPSPEDCSAMAARVANGLSQIVGRTVVDRTGLTGNWAFELTYSAEPSPDSDAPSLFTAIQEQLGLKLEATTGPVDVLVVDRVQRPTPD